MKKIFLLSMVVLLFFFGLLPTVIYAINLPTMGPDASTGGGGNSADTENPPETAGSSNSGSSGGAGVALVDPITGKTGGNLNSIDLLAERLIKYVLGVSGVAALIAFVYGGVTWLISLGDTAKIAKGKNIMVWALMGLVVMFSAYAMVSLIFGALGLR